MHLPDGGDEDNMAGNEVAGTFVSATGKVVIAEVVVGLTAAFLPPAFWRLSSTSKSLQNFHRR